MTSPASLPSLASPYFTRLRALVASPADLDAAEARATTMPPAAALRLVAAIATDEEAYAPTAPSAGTAAALLAIHDEALAEAKQLERRALDARIDRACGMPVSHKIGTAPVAAGGAS